MESILLGAILGVGAYALGKFMGKGYLDFGDFVISVLAIALTLAMMTVINVIVGH